MMPYIALIAAYLVGSLPTGYIFSRLFQKTDIRDHGSGNMGATNVLRVMGWRAALPVLILDVLKGVAAVLLARAAGGDTAFYLAAGFLAMVGHSFPVFLGFRGGKAVATCIGVLITLSVTVTAGFIIIAGVIIALTRFVSLGTIVGSLSLPFLFWVFGFEGPYVLFGLATALLIAWRHQANIGRLLKGNESKLGHKA
jgi:acyl phosphate:glycerol-3-phosphate acyltransferase